jgi:hypothetical protein
MYLDICHPPTCKDYYRQCEALDHETGSREVGCVGHLRKHKAVRRTLLHRSRRATKSSTLGRELGHWDEYVLLIGLETRKALECMVFLPAILKCEVKIVYIILLEFGVV